MDQKKIVRLLLREARRSNSTLRRKVDFTKDPEADRLLNDLRRYPHLYVLGCVMDRQIKAAKAWMIPCVFARRIGGPEFERFQRLSRRRITRIMTTPKPLHRFTSDMSSNFYSAIRHIDDRYGGRASRIWQRKPSSADLVYRFLEFPGVGPKIATMAANILVRNFKIELSDYYSIDISADVHVRRVFARLGLVRTGATVEEIVYRARAMYPEFPGIFDYCAFDVGRSYCRPQQPLCVECPLYRLCPSRRRGI